MRDIDFTSAKTMKKKLDAKLKSGDTTPTICKQKVNNIPDPTVDELSLLFKSLSEINSKPAILSLIPEYQEIYVPQPMKENFPTILTEMRDDSALELNYVDLLKECKNQFREISVTEEQAKAVENSTREQSNSELWYRFRAGRMTASKMKSACCTDPTLPAQSFIKSVCYPESYKFSSNVTDWGCQHEKFARDIFTDKLRKEHENLKVEEVGFFINPNVPFIGASPDGIVTCDCCGQAVVEIKCPFCKKHDSLENASDDKNFYLKKDNDGNLKLNTKHMYYYQVQTQLGVCQMESGYFVVWTEKDLHIEQIVFNNELWKEICDKSKHLFITAILPELIGKFYSRLPNRQPLKPVVNNNLCEKESKSKDNEELWCFCAQVESGENDLL